MNFDISILVIILIKTITTKIYRSVYSQFELNDRASLYINLTSYNIQEFYPINQQVDASYFSKRLHKISLNIKGTDALMINNSQYTRYHLNEKIAFSNVIVLYATTHWLILLSIIFITMGYHFHLIIITSLFQ